MPCSGRLREALGSAGLFASSEADVKIAAPTITFGPQHAPSPMERLTQSANGSAARNSATSDEPRMATCVFGHARTSPLRPVKALRPPAAVRFAQP